MTKTRVLTGITTTGTPHLGNYLGAIKPAVKASKDKDLCSFFFLADYHALIKCHDPARVAQSTREIAATWLALGMDADNATFYRQSDIPEITELTWMLTCVTSKGLMNRAHAYKASVDENRNADKTDLDDGVTMGLFSYPVLMAADILMFNGEKIPVGKDQIQHIEMARDIAGRFNHTFADLFTLPEAMIDEDPLTISGLDGRKMSKSYDNTIPLFCSEDQLRKLINQIHTDLREPGEPKDPDTSTLFELYSSFASEEETAAYRVKFYEGIGWGDAKKELFEYLNNYLSEPRQRYTELMNDLGAVELVLQQGAEKAREYSVPMLKKVREAVGIQSLNSTITVAAEGAQKKKEKSEEQIARAEEGRRRGILMQLKPVLDKVANAEDSVAAAREVLEEKEQQVASLKKKAKQKAENELAVLQEEFASLFS
ncbi:tryptophan--tRNA ligase [Motiliproteus sp. MSK22-1]|uniref:tryptophan--tRNA ligase n=1 Tax=Motiliproteus sp. MSK22-1 TaxID=1897630 RepID=UPI000976FEE0|nr:tryptophan--tRNA ligase [Motiliproteus sp. MSK22-1]